MDFQTYHKYNRLVRRGLAKPLCCQHCDGEFTLGFGDRDEPVLKCYFCNVTVYPGKNMYDNIRAQVEEFFVEEKDD